MFGKGGMLARKFFFANQFQVFKNIQLANSEMKAFQDMFTVNKEEHNPVKMFLN